MASGGRSGLGRVRHGGIAAKPEPFVIVDFPCASVAVSAPSPRVRLGTRNSPLARWQADHVAALLRSTGALVEIIPITTAGDTLRGSLTTAGGEGLFTKAIQNALLAGEVDLAVHSLKDLPTTEIAGLALAAVPEREIPFDAIVRPVGRSEASPTGAILPDGAVVGTGSIRRQAQLLHARPDLTVRDIRGNVETRLAKLDEGQFDAILLAVAGLTRLGLTDRISQVVPPEMMLPAVGQGALGLETRADDTATREAVSALRHEPSEAAVRAERALLAGLRAGCLAPVGAYATVADGQITLRAAVLSPDGRHRIARDGQAPVAEAVALGQAVADRLLADGAAELIAAVGRISDPTSVSDPATE